jgi:hypothetical protein
VSWRDVVHRLRRGLQEHSRGLFTVHVRSTYRASTRELTLEEQQAIGRAFAKFEQGFKELDPLFRTNNR